MSMAIPPRTIIDDKVGYIREKFPDLASGEKRIMTRCITYANSPLSFAKVFYNIGEFFKGLFSKADYQQMPHFITRVLELHQSRMQQPLAGTTSEMLGPVDQISRIFVKRLLDDKRSMESIVKDVQSVASLNLIKHVPSELDRELPEGEMKARYDGFRVREDADGARISLVNSVVKEIFPDLNGPSSRRPNAPRMDGQSV